MRLIVTGGGTGGHVYPALEVARAATEAGAEVAYFGSLRGQEGKASVARGIPFFGFPSAPMLSPLTVRGVRSRYGMLRAVVGAHRSLREWRPDVVFSTGGYSAAPVLLAARRLRVPTVLLESNSVPGRTTRMFIPTSAAFAYVFRHTGTLSYAGSGVRTGQPVREALRRAADGLVAPAKPLVLVMGGSQGSAFLNEAVPKAMVELPGVEVLHATGPRHFDSVAEAVRPLGLGTRYQLVPYLQEAELLEAYRRSTLAVGRSGGTLAEFAVFRLPSVLVPLPQSADDHQRVNAQEFAHMHAATVCEQPSLDLAAQIRSWMEAPERHARAAESLEGWDLPDATASLVRLIEEARR